MEWGKYIIITCMGHEVAVMFDPLLDHATIAEGKNVISAGFFAVEAEPTEKNSLDISVSTFSKSITLQKESRKTDNILLKRVLRKESEY
ncbi:MAG TPA: hypothetical protein VMX17_13180 [Candidatus Glassbacteria bacterium]|nr:hypothetical protein [Candidatus Glassbacteria bacterium]